VVMNGMRAGSSPDRMLNTLRDREHLGLPRY
jgi:hypothetical protein